MYHNCVGLSWYVFIRIICVYNECLHIFCASPYSVFKWNIQHARSISSSPSRTHIHTHVHIQMKRAQLPMLCISFMLTTVRARRMTTKTEFAFSISWSVVQQYCVKSQHSSNNQDSLPSCCDVCVGSRQRCNRKHNFLTRFIRRIRSDCCCVCVCNFIDFIVVGNGTKNETRGIVLLRGVGGRRRTGSISVRLQNTTTVQLLKGNKLV